MSTPHWKPNPLWPAQMTLAIERAYLSEVSSLRVALGQFLCGGFLSLKGWTHLFRSARQSAQGKSFETFRLEPLPPRKAKPSDTAPVPISSGHFERWRKLCASPSYRLGQALFHLAKGELRAAWRDLTGPPARQTFALLDREPPPFLEKQLPDKSNPDRLAFVAPAWLEEMLSYEEAIHLGHFSQLPTIVCLGGGPLPSPPPDLNQEVTAWLLSDDLSEIDRAWLQNSSRVIQPQQLPAAVQPKLHNPIGWWHGLPGLLLSKEEGQNIPASWRTQFALARAERPMKYPQNTYRRDACRYIEAMQTIKTRNLRSRISWLANELRVDGFSPVIPLVSALLSTCRPHLLQEGIESFCKQTYPNKELILALHGRNFDMKTVNQLVSKVTEKVTIINVPAERTLGTALRLASDMAEGQCLWKLDDDDYYAPQFLDDVVTTLQYSDAGIVGKPCMLIELQESGEYFWAGTEMELRYFPGAAGGPTMLIRREVFDKVNWRDTPSEEDVYFAQDSIRQGVPILRGSRYYFRCIRRGNQHHTWKTTKETLLNWGMQQVCAENACEFFLCS